MISLYFKNNTKKRVLKRRVKLINRATRKGIRSAKKDIFGAFWHGETKITLNEDYMILYLFDNKTEEKVRQNIISYLEKDERWHIHRDFHQRIVLLLKD